MVAKTIATVFFFCMLSAASAAGEWPFNISVHGAMAMHHKGHASNRIFSGAETKSKLVGFYSAEEFEGVISHQGERVHIHYADDNMKMSGHLDSFNIRKGATLLLPKR